MNNMGWVRRARGVPAHGSELGISIRVAMETTCSRLMSGGAAVLISTGEVQRPAITPAPHPRPRALRAGLEPTTSLYFNN